jgi:ankyrin repeat protein
VVQALLRRKVAVDLQNHDGDTALMAASRAGNALACRALIAAGASTSLRNTKRATAVDVARDRGFLTLASEIDGKKG